MIMKNNEKSLKQMSENLFRFDFYNRMESYHPEHLLVYYIFLKNLFFSVRSQLPVYL